MLPEWMLILVPLLPLLGGLIGLVLRRQERLAAGVGLISLLSSVGLALSFLKAGAVAWSVPWLGTPQIDIVAAAYQEIVRGQATSEVLGQAVVNIPLAVKSDVMQWLFVLTTALIACVVLVFALRERRDDPQAAQFHGLITLFAGSMLLFLVADTLLLMYLAWELMGVMSYFLIAHPRTKEARRAARQAFWTTRTTDFGLLFAIIILMSRFGWTTVSQIDVGGLITELNNVGVDPAAALSLLGWVMVLIILAVLGKAAQWPLSFWLPDAMVAPAPVSALLHAATMVAAGPFLLVRLPIELYSTDARVVILATLVGGVTLLMGGLMALTAQDPKRVLAYSTVSQLGLVILAVGVFFPAAGYFHLLSHAWFKAALFLGVGYLAVVWHAKNSGQHSVGAGVTGSPTLRDLSGQAARSPITKWGVLILAGISLAGVPLLAGSLGKEQVLFALLNRPSEELAPGTSFGDYFNTVIPLWRVGVVVFLLAIPVTAAYITRLITILCWPAPGERMPDQEATPLLPEQAPDQPEVTIRSGWGLPLLLTSAMAFIGSIGMSLLWFTWYVTPKGFHAESDLTWGDWSNRLFLITLALSVLGVAAGVWLAAAYLRGSQERRDRIQSWPLVAPLASFFAHGMYLREAFNTVLGRWGEILAVLAGRADMSLIDWLVMNTGRFGRGLSHGAAWVDVVIVDALRRGACGFWWGIKYLHSRWMQTGKIQHYMFIILIATVLLCLAIIKPLGDICGRMLSNLYAGGDRWSI